MKIDLANNSKIYYGNRVEISSQQRTDDALTLHFIINFGYRSNFLAEETLEGIQAQKEISQGTFWFENQTLYAGTEDRLKVFYTLNLSKYAIPDDWHVKISHYGNRLRSVGIEARIDSNFSAEFLNQDHLHRTDDALCLTSTPKGSFIYRDKLVCTREVNHLGAHQTVEDKFGLVIWDSKGGSQGNPHNIFGNFTSCPYCGLVIQKSSTTCFDCSHFLKLAKESNGWIIDGSHYMPGLGGFGGRKFAIKNKDGTEWKGELFTQGVVPEYLLQYFSEHKFAEFVDTKAR